MENKTMRTAKLKDVRRELDNGGYVRFIWGEGGAWLISANHDFMLLDGRTYQGFLHTVAPTLSRIETGSTDTNNLVIDWRKA